jgi:hypothetical protein
MRFHDVVGRLNESDAMQRGVLLVPVSLANIRDKRPLQYAVEENIRSCRHYLLVLSDGWGPPERDLKPDYDYALESIANPESPMQSVAVIAKSTYQGPVNPRATWSTPEEFDARVAGILSGWLDSIPPSTPR